MDWWLCSNEFRNCEYLWILWNIVQLAQDVSTLSKRIEIKNFQRLFNIIDMDDYSVCF